MTGRLSEYNEKRNFTKTLEPEGKIDSDEQLRFVVQHHLARNDHYDLRLEWQGALLSWAVPKGPSYNTHDKRLAVQVEDHPLEYRNFEGMIPKGEYGGGVVMLWDEGLWEPRGNVDEGLIEGSLKFVLHGRRLKGKWALVRLKSKDGETRDNWLLLKEKDEHAKNEVGIATFTTSIRTDRSMSEIAAGAETKITRNPFDRADVQLAKLITKVPVGEDWLYELKYDGYRILAFVEGNSVRLMTRNDNDYTRRFSGVATALITMAAGRAMILDGEMTITNPEGKTDFQALQNYLKNPQEQSLTYIVFDLLALDGMDLRGRPLIDRKAALEALLKDAPGSIYYSRHVIGKGKESFLAACEAGLEGIIGKRMDSLYRSTRNGDWIKLKCEQRRNFVIGGYTLSDKKTSGVSSLLLGIYEGEDFIYCGRAGTGFSERERKKLAEHFRSLHKAEPSFKEAPQARSNERITWLEPQLVAEIKFAEWTEDQRLRQASFKGLQADKHPRDIQKETTINELDSPQEAENPKELESKMVTKDNSIVIAGIKITNPDKVMFEEPKISKADVVRYYEMVSERMLPHVSYRVLSIVRCPKGISQTCFYKKHPGPDSKGIITLPITTGSGEIEDYFYIENKLGLISEAQMGTLEFHTWGSRIEVLEKPDLMVFDLDPDEGMDLSRVRQGVRDVKSILSELSLNAYLKTSGGKGYHVVVPLEPSVSWEVFYSFARGVAEVMEQKWPDRYTSNVRKAKRAGKIFIDWIRNGRGATSIAPYSLRTRKGAKVSMPIDWDELDTIAPDGIDMAEALARMAGADPWQDFFRAQQKLK
ncbi:ATP-dependent DNA ligase LigD polymerase module [Desulfitobacterium dichloroeliminans LMG P-21439]|uniref:DNA ligase (ATP) n=1 Tax=Desulfitobacterium dichloroeliminans (strain LMG P-21439 / DCA1) TaxID=871963 RepID=L0F8G4_DESDL|nr:DNA ligase D [Desulfitobacterium dichloroeliminans]AGA70099.1 ATP-dependent DNA ligase LigD polymerase module [Desulfitobacterium dichloroeliminans LMG P-21439]